VKVSKEHTVQINIDKKTGSLLLVIAVLVAALGFAVTRNDGFNHNGHHGMAMMNDDESSATSNLTGADVMFLQMMIPHHQQAVDISNLALKTSKDKELLALATTIRDAQTSEITQMQKWLRDANVSPGMGHSMSGMGGMLSASELSALNAASGKTFDIVWLEGMIGHHDGAIHMTTMIADAQNATIRAFGKAIIKDQTAQIDQMKLMLKRLNG
jgi:uncharacterized protein (DUF305 family)